MKNLEGARFAAGCFWHVEKEFSKLAGVISTVVGYSGGTSKNPTYEEVCSGTTGHAETIDISFDPKKISYKELLQVLWRIHNPTTLNRQGADIGTNYRSIIFYFSEKQKKTALASKKQHEKLLGKKIVTEIILAVEFYPAEEYHQKYFQKQEVVCGI